MLDKIFIGLVQTTEPGNIGAAARAMKTMGLTNLRLINPRKFPHPKATSRASQATDVLENARVFSNLKDAIADCGMVFGASSRRRSIEVPTMSPKEAAEYIAKSQTNQPIAILFGRESDGLSNEELDLCQYLITIPTAKEYAALNLAAAVQVITYELQQVFHIPPDEIKKLPDFSPATVKELQALWQHLEQTLIEIHFLFPENPGLIMRRLQRMFLRANLTSREVKILRGVLTAIQKNTRTNML